MDRQRSGPRGHIMEAAAEGEERGHLLRARLLVARLLQRRRGAALYRRDHALERLRAH